jgi:hypothetical protein
MGALALDHHSTPTILTLNFRQSVCRAAERDLERSQEELCAKVGDGVNL